jgi:hypothetical protein
MNGLDDNVAKLRTLIPLGRVHTHNMKKYKIISNAAEAQADAYAVVYVPRGEVLSRHRSSADARTAVRRYESADAKRHLRNI